MNQFALSDRSLDKLEGVNIDLVNVVKVAITVTKVDFGVSCGRRTKEQQRDLVDRGLSQTMKSKHLTGNAVDVFAYVHGKVLWEPEYYFPIADAFREAANNLMVDIRWGGAWEFRHPDGGTTKRFNFSRCAEETQSSYVKMRRDAGYRPFIDMPHFELMT